MLYLSYPVGDTAERALETATDLAQCMQIGTSAGGDTVRSRTRAARPRDRRAGSADPATGWSRSAIIGGVDRVADYVEKVTEQAGLLVAGNERAYDIARRTWTLGMDGMSTEALRDVAWPVWLIWGDLTDRVDGPRGREPGAEEAASVEMRRASAEWLLVADDAVSRAEYFDRWVYEECGYERKPPEADL